MLGTLVLVLGLKFRPSQVIRCVYKGWVWCCRSWFRNSKSPETLDHLTVHFNRYIMAVFSYVAVISLIIQTAYCLSPSNSGRSIHISLSQRESIGSPHLTRRTGVAAEGVNIDAVCSHYHLVLTFTSADIRTGVLVRRLLSRRFLQSQPID